MVYGPPSCTWLDRVYPYVENTGIYFCPAHPEGGKTTTELGWPPAGSGELVSSYGYSEQFDYIPGGYAVPTLGAIRHAVDKIAFCPGPGTNDFGFSAVLRVENIAAVLDGGSGAGGRHNRGGNYSFLDGHARWMSYIESAGDL